MSHPRLVKDLIWRETDDGIVVVDPSEGKVRVLNGVGSVIWKLLSQEKSAADIESYIVDSFDIAAEQASADVGAFLSQLAERGMITTPQ